MQLNSLLTCINYNQSASLLWILTMSFGFPLSVLMWAWNSHFDPTKAKNVNLVVWDRQWRTPTPPSFSIKSAALITQQLWDPVQRMLPRKVRPKGRKITPLKHQRMWFQLIQLIFDPEDDHLGGDSTYSCFLFSPIWLSKSCAEQCISLQRHSVIEQ